LLVLVVIAHNAAAQPIPEAIPIQIGQLVTGTIQDQFDEHWFVFDIPIDGSFTAVILPDSTDLNTWIQLADETGFVFKSSDPYVNTNPGDVDTLRFPNLREGRYSLRVTGSTSGGYQYYTSFQPWLGADGTYLADTEPNDDPASAMNMHPNHPVSGHLGFSGIDTDLQDWYTFTTSGGDVSIRLEAGGQLGSVLRLWDAAASTYITAEISAYGESIGTMSVPDLPAGTYLIQVHRWGTGDGSNEFFGHYNITVLTEHEPEPDYVLSGRVTNALTGDPIAGAFVMIGGYEVMTDQDGIYRFFELPDSPVSISLLADTTSGMVPFTVDFQSEIRSGFATIRVVADGFAPFVFNGLPIGESLVFDASLSPELIDADLRFVLNWGAEPHDLDSHMKTPDGYHVYFAEIGSATEPPFSTLDHDITTGYGPETITLVQRTPGTYHYYVYLYSGEGSIATSGAVVQIYDRDGLLMSVEPPSSGEDLYWYVATINGETGRITLINELTSIEPGEPSMTKSISKSDLTGTAIASEWSYLWDFGDTGTSTDPNPSHTYLEPGLFDVSLDATHSDGRSGFFLRREYITVEADTVIIEPEPLLSGQVTNALSGEPIAGALVEVANMQTFTDSSGTYRFFELPETSTQVTFSADTTSGFAPLNVHFTSDLREGFHTIVVTAEGFASFRFSGLMVDEATVFDLSLSPYLVDADLRFVLNWSAIPRDLDSHMKTPDGFEVYYGSRGNAIEAPFVTLDHDITSGYGPETITLVNRINGTYHYYIYNYSAEADITTSLAVVQIYDRQGLLESLEIPVTGEGRYWHVADVDGATGRIDIINRIQDIAPGEQWTEKRTAKSDLVADVSSWSYEWTFGDQNTSSEPNPMHLYTSPGVYSVSLTVSLEDHSASFTRRDFIHVLDPIADIQAINDTVTVVAGTIVRIDPLANDHIPDTLSVHFGLDDWTTNFGMLMMTADHRALIYASALNARGTDTLRYSFYYEGGYSSAQILIHVVDGVVVNQAPVIALPVEISILEDSTLAIPMRKLVFDDHDALNQLTIQVMSVNPAVRADLSPMRDTLRIWADPNWWGTSVLSMTVTDQDGGASTDHVTITIIPVNDAPVAHFLKLTEDLTDLGLVVDFQDQSHDNFDMEGAITSWAWDFGDETTSSERHPQHTYTRSGEFTVRLTVTDNGGLTASAETTIISMFTSVEESERITEFRLHGAYPNPFNPTTMIRVDVPETGDVAIDVYNSMGQRITSIIQTLAVGQHNVAINALGWSSGVYLYTITYKDQIVTSKMTLIK
jgi:PKD repeat protein/uncharacterized protein YfaP (DUF2135 family)